jgi:hypothetical protein
MFNDRLTFISAGSRWVVLPRQQLRAGDRRGVIDGWAAALMLDEWCDEPGSLARVLELFQRVFGDPVLQPTTLDVERRIKPLLQRELTDGRWVALKLPLFHRREQEKDDTVLRGPTPDPEPPPEGPRLLRRISEKTFIDVSVQDTDGVPLSGFNYQLQLPSGVTDRGVLGADARLFRGNIDPGIGRLTISPGSSEVVQADDLTPPDEPEVPDDSIEIQLVDQSGAPVADETVEILFSDGSSETAVTDDNGNIALQGVPSGDCQITLPKSFPPAAT